MTSYYKICGNYDEQPSDATIRVYIKNLRELLGREKIVTIRGIGYKFEQK